VRAGERGDGVVVISAGAVPRGSAVEGEHRGDSIWSEVR
jgi:hypothetical protein